MTRHQRMGTIAILVIVAVLLSASWMMRSCQADEIQNLPETEFREFENEVDSVLKHDRGVKHQAKKHVGKKKRESHKGRRAKPDKKPGHDAPRKLDPVPQF